MQNMEVKIVLVRPRNPLNIGAAARAMANFGFSDLVVVKPYAPVWRETVSAVGAERLVLEAKVCKSLEEAVADCHLVVGTTAVRDRHLSRPVVRLPDFFDFLKKYAPSPGLRPHSPASGRGKNPVQQLKVALLFGSEKTGLSNKYLERCHAYLTVPTHPKTPSMNLSHSVAVCCYELARQKAGLGVPTRDDTPLATAEQTQRLAQQALEMFEALDYLSFLPATKRMQKIRRTLLQWRLHATDVRLLHGIFRHMIKKLKPGGPQ